MEGTACLICQGDVKPFISFGKMPIANAFLTPAQFSHEYFFSKLEAGVCAQCGMAQLTERVDPSKMFHAEYAYFSSISTRMAQHFREWADWVKASYLPEPNPLVVEIGSNDGILLQHFVQPGMRHVGIEPSANVAAAARTKGIDSRVVFFNESSALALRKEFGPADVIMGANVICHIADLHAVASGVEALLKPKGVFIFQEPYLGDIVEKASYDQIYDEHIFYFCLHSLQKFFASHGMEIIHVESHDVHGGSMRYVVARKGARPVQDSVRKWWKHEEDLKLADFSTYQKLSDRILQSKDQLVRLLKDLKRQGKKIAGYGATSKSTTVTNFCGIGPELIDYITDTTPNKQGKFSPGVHIPIMPYEHFKKSPPDYALLFAWNHGQEILDKEHAFVQEHGQFIVYVPAVQVVDSK